MGQKFAAFDPRGAVVAFYDDEDSPAPTGVEVVEITREAWTALLGEQGKGKVLQRGRDGHPEAVDPPAPPPPTTDQVLAVRDAMLSAAAQRIAPLQDAVDIADATAAEKARLKAWKQYRVALNRIELQGGFPTAVEWPKAPA